MLLTDENMRPVAVQIPYSEWLEIEMVIENNLKKRGRIAHLAGSIQLPEDPLKYQKRTRNEWP